MDRLLLQAIVFIFFSLGVLTASGAVCPAANTAWNSCNGGTETIIVDWTNYPSMACQEVQIVIPVDYEMDSCTWRVELMNIPATTQAGITVNAVPGGAADNSDTLVITSELMGSQTTEFTSSLSDLYTMSDSSIPPRMSLDGLADAVEVSFTRTTSTAFSGAGFTLRVVLYAIDAATVCADVTSPKSIVLTTDYPKAALATPNFAVRYPRSSECYTNVMSPENTQIRVDYLYIDVTSLQDRLFIFDSSTTGEPLLLRLETSGSVDAAGLEQRSFDSETNRLHVSFQDTLFAEARGILMLFSAVDTPLVSTACTTCNCPADTTSSGDAECKVGGTFVSVTGPVEQACATTVTLDWTEAMSHAFLATPRYNSGGYEDSDTSPCRWTIAGPINSELIIIFKDFDLGSRDSFFINPTMNQGRIFRLSGTDPMITYNDGSGQATFTLVDSEINCRSDRATIGLILNSNDGETGQGVSLEIRVADNRCDPRCINGGQCDCTCASGYLGARCNVVIPITLALVTASSITEGSSFEVECATPNRLLDETQIELQVLDTSTAFEGPLYDFPTLASYPCVIAAGSRSGTVTIPTIDDTIMEENEEIVLGAGTIAGGADPTAADASPEVMVTLMDTPDGNLLQVEFSSSSYEVSEGAGTFTGTIEFKYLNNYYPIPEAGTIDLGYSYETASNSDITEVTTVSFLESSQPMTSTVLFEIPIDDDSIEESTEVFHLYLSLTGTPVNIVEGAVRRSTVWIQDNDFVDNVAVIDNPEIHKLAGSDVHIFAFSSSNLALSWTKENPRPRVERAGLIINGNQYGETLTLPLTPNWLPARRLGHYILTLGSNEAIDAFVKPKSDCLTLSGGSTITVYPSASDNSMLSETLKFGLESGNSCPTDLKWKKDGNDISNSNPTYRVTTRADAEGVFTIFRRNREEEGWFAMIKVKVSECPLNTYKDGSGACTLTCPECKNGGVCEKDGTCTCPPCFTGPLCEYKQTISGAFGRNSPFLCSDLQLSVSSSVTRQNCEGFMFCFGGLYGCSCGCGWNGTDCKQACGQGYYGANCNQKCSDCSKAQCDTFTGCP